MEGGMGPWRARRSENNTSDRSEIRGAWRRTRVKHMKTQRSGGLGVGGETQVCCVCLLTSSGKDPEIIHVCNTFGLGLVKAESDTSKIHEDELCRGSLHPSNEQLRKANCLDKRTNRPRGVCREARCEWTAVKSCAYPPLVPPGESRQLF